MLYKELKFTNVSGADVEENSAETPFFSTLKGYQGAYHKFSFLQSLLDLIHL